jgi:hypothetical protein
MVVHHAIESDALCGSTGARGFYEKEPEMIKANGVYDGNYDAMVAERQFEEKRFGFDEYECPVCGEWIQMDWNVLKVTCRTCKSKLVLDPDGDVEGGEWRNVSRLRRVK